MTAPGYRLQRSDLEAINQCVTFKKTYEPKHADLYRKKHILFNKVYDQVAPLFTYD